MGKQVKLIVGCQGIDNSEIVNDFEQVVVSITTDVLKAGGYSPTNVDHGFAKLGPNSPLSTYYSASIVITSSFSAARKAIINALIDKSKEIKTYTAWLVHIVNE